MAVNRNIFLGLGSNLGDREKNLLLAIKKIHSVAGTVIAVSSLYKAEPWGKTNQPEFLNQVIELETYLEPGKLLETLLRIEKELGRVRNEPWGPRTIDLDILFYGQEVISEETLVIPHPAIAERKFVLLPLCELYPALLHPQLHLTCSELLARCEDPLRVELYRPG